MNSSCTLYCNIYRYIVTPLTYTHRNNLLRWCILRVLQESEKHLDKVLNVEEFVKRIHGVIHSNDYVARALTLRYHISCFDLNKVDIASKSWN